MIKEWRFFFRGETAKQVAKVHIRKYALIFLKVDYFHQERRFSRKKSTRKLRHKKKGFFTQATTLKLMIFFKKVFEMNHV